MDAMGWKNKSGMFLTKPSPASKIMKNKHLQPQYSGDKSHSFWRAINKEDNLRLYRMGCRLQNLEDKILKILHCKKQVKTMKNKMEKEKELIEKLAAIEHERWADWQKYMHSRGTITPDGCFLAISLAQIKAWERQINTPYSELSEKEKESDRRQVRRYWNLISSSPSNLNNEK